MHATGQHPYPPATQYVPTAAMPPRPHSGQRSVTPGSTTSGWTPDPSVGHLLNIMRGVGPKIPIDFTGQNDVAADEAEEDYEFLVHLLKSRELNALVKAHNVILFCNQEQCPCVSNACQITADVMEDIRPYCLMIEECRELYAILTTPHIRVSMF